MRTVVQLLPEYYKHVDLWADRTRRATHEKLFLSFGKTLMSISCLLTCSLKKMTKITLVKQS